MQETHKEANQGMLYETDKQTYEEVHGDRGGTLRTEPIGEGAGLG